LKKLIKGERKNDFIHSPIVIDDHKSVSFRGRITIDGERREGLLSFNSDGSLK